MKRIVVVTLAIAVGATVWFWTPKPRRPADDEPERTVPPASSTTSADSKSGLRELIPVDTSRLLALPYPYEVENAFPNVSFGNQRPLQLLAAPDSTNRLFVVCQEGKIHVFENRADVKSTHVFLDLSDKASRKGNEEGLLGLAFHPKYKQNGEFFVCYSAEGPKSVVSRFRVAEDDANLAKVDSEQVLLEVAQPHRTQNGGSLEFGPDGYLYIGLGDGGSANDPQDHGQNLETLLGSVLRIDVDRKDAGLAYGIPKDNPFVDRGGKVRGEIWAYGFRNVWRLAFDSATGDLWTGDVGQDRFEEVNLVVKGGNYGWNKREGRYAFRANLTGMLPLPTNTAATVDEKKFIEPVTTYFHSEGRAVVGGRVYRGKRFADLDGAYLYGDFVAGNIWAAYYKDDDLIKEVLICNAKLQIAGFGEDADGEVYLCSFDGNIYRLRANEDYLDGGKRKFPYLLSDTGLFESTSDLKPVRGMIPYSVNVPLWSDHAGKERYLVLPDKGTVEFSEQGAWQFPVGTVVVKHFFMDSTGGEANSRMRLETRLLVHGSKGWDGYTYHWNDKQTDAVLMDAAVTLPIEVNTADGATVQNWYFPSRSDCKACHTKTAGFVLSINTRQLNRDHDYQERRANQLDTLNAIGVFTKPLPAAADSFEAFPDWTASEKPTEKLARAYLDVNCAFCHAPGGPGNSAIDLRFHTQLSHTNLVGTEPRGTRFSGPPASALLMPNRPGDSELVRRIQLRGPGQMPTFATFKQDAKAVSLIERWIEELSTSND